MGGGKRGDGRGATSNLRPFEVVGRSENRGHRGGKYVVVIYGILKEKFSLLFW